MREYYTEVYYASHLNSKINDHIDVDQLYGNSCATLPPHGDPTTLPPQRSKFIEYSKEIANLSIYLFYLTITPNN